MSDLNQQTLSDSDVDEYGMSDFFREWIEEDPEIQQFFDVQDKVFDEIVKSKLHSLFKRILSTVRIEKPTLGYEFELRDSHWIIEGYQPFIGEQPPISTQGTIIIRKKQNGLLYGIPYRIDNIVEARYLQKLDSKMLNLIHNYDSQIIDAPADIVALYAFANLGSDFEIKFHKRTYIPHLNEDVDSYVCFFPVEIESRQRRMFGQLQTYKVGLTPKNIWKAFNLVGAFSFQRFFPPELRVEEAKRLGENVAEMYFAFETLNNELIEAGQNITKNNLDNYKHLRLKYAYIFPEPNFSVSRKKANELFEKYWKQMQDNKDNK